MHRADVRRKFNCSGVAILPVIHVLDYDQICYNIDALLDEGAPGCFLINHDFGVAKFLPLIMEVRENYPSLWFGVNFLGQKGHKAFPVLGKLAAKGWYVDAYWADDAGIEEHLNYNDQVMAKLIKDTKTESSWDGLYFGGVAFKKQREVDFKDLHMAAEKACGYMDVVVTSGWATGVSAPIQKIQEIRQGVGEKQAVGLASGVTPDNIETYRDYIDTTLVATGINRPGDFYNIDPPRLRALLRNA